MMHLLLSHNPYSGVSFFEFFAVLAQRLFCWMTGEGRGTLELASDELQILVLLGVAAACALVGTFLVLRKMTMLANALSHTILVGIILAFLLMRQTISHDGHFDINLTSMGIAALVTGIGTTWLTQWLTSVVRLQEDASIGLVFTSLFAVGVVLVTLFSKNAHLGTEIVMGSIDALNRQDLVLVYTILALDVLVIFTMFKEFKLTAFDAGFSRVIGIPSGLYHYLLMILLSATVIGAFRVVGVLMVLAFLVGPVVTARLFTHHLGKMILWAITIGSSASIIGVATARHLLSEYSIALTTGGVVVCILTLIYIAALLGVSLKKYKERCRVTSLTSQRSPDR